ncbi:MAG: hypothetical protein PHY29_11470 [Syntrophales bacterium]|nr:hypothetical protein [Syntrophales bacterium]
MASFNWFEHFTVDLAEGVHANALNADTDVLRVALSNTAPTPATDAVFADITEISAGNGYTAGGDDIANAASKSGTTITVAGTDVVFTASAGPIGPFRYVILYNDTPADPVDPLIGYWDYGSSITLADGEMFTVDFGAAVFTVG